MIFIRGILDRIILVAAVIAAGCIPSFVAQYRQRLGGRLDQVLQDIAPFQKIADQFHQGNLQKLIQHHLDSTDATFHKEGAALDAMIESAEMLRKAMRSLDTDLIHQLLYLITNMDPVIARATWEIFTPSFSLTVESIAFASGIGIVIWLVFLLIWFGISRMLRVLTAS